VSTANTARDGYRVAFTTTTVLFGLRDGTGSTNYNAITGAPHRDGNWHHYAMTFDSATNEMRGYVDGMLRTITTATRDVSANASCTTSLNPNETGSGYGFLFFDMQILPDVVVPPGDIRLLMDPRVQYPGVKGRYFGLNFRTTAAGTGALLDESGNGNNLTVSPSTIHQGPEPPWRQVLGL
jgi:hypothetical protein